MAVGLFFFIRASVKDRTKEIRLVSEESSDSLLNQLEAYFNQRAYRIATVDPKQNQVTFQGFVRPSKFLAVFLSLLAALSLFCLGLVFSFQFPTVGNLFLGLTLLAPIAGVFYWQKAGRVEKVLLKVETMVTQDQTAKSLITITAHRDELIQLQQAALPLKAV